MLTPCFSCKVWWRNVSWNHSEDCRCHVTSWTACETGHSHGILMKVTLSATKLPKTCTRLHIALFLHVDLCSQTTKRSSLQQCPYQRSGRPDRRVIKAHTRWPQMLPSSECFWSNFGLTWTFFTRFPVLLNMMKLHSEPLLTQEWWLNDYTVYIYIYSHTHTAVWDTAVKKILIPSVQFDTRWVLVTAQSRHNVGALRVKITSLLRFALSIGFVELSLTDQIHLLKCCWLEILMLGLMWRSVDHPGKLIFSPDFKLNRWGGDHLLKGHSSSCSKAASNSTQTRLSA